MSSFESLNSPQANADRLGHLSLTPSADKEGADAKSALAVAASAASTGPKGHAVAKGSNGDKGTGKGASDGRPRIYLGAAGLSKISNHINNNIHIVFLNKF